jgi:aspartyl-tRNA(Asn)/glutamyl-tRNA(Gln) amidotransferase subunit B
LREKGSNKLNPRSEIKNLNSFKSLEKALQYEEKRLRKLWEETNGPLKGDITVGWMDDEEKTRLLRDKESATDYRYFPEPDIPPLHVTSEMLKDIGKDLPPLPYEQKKQYVTLGLTDAEATLLIDQPKLQMLFHGIYEKTKDAKKASSIVLTQLVGFLNENQKPLESAPELPRMLELVDAIVTGTISGNAGKTVLEKMILTGKSAPDIIKEEGMGQISDEGALEDLVKKAIAANPKAIESYKAGKESALGAVVGWMMKETKGQANPAKVNEILKKHL